jgi:hypothetical protein
MVEKTGRLVRLLTVLHNIHYAKLANFGNNSYVNDFMYIYIPTTLLACLAI